MENSNKLKIVQGTYIKLLGFYPNPKLANNVKPNLDVVMKGGKAEWNHE